MPMSATLLAVSTSVHSSASAQADSPFHGNEPALASIHLIIDSAYVGMVQSKGGPSLTAEPFQGSAIARDLLGQEFRKATIPVQLCVLGPIDQPIPPAPQFLCDP